MTMSRRQWLQVSGAALGGTLGAPLAAAEAPSAAAPTTPPAIAALRPMLDGVAPISVDEHRARLARAQALLREQRLDALLLGPGTSLRYFTGAQWSVSERFFGLLLTRAGDPAWIVPAFEERRGREQIQVGGDVRAWEEDESPYALMAAVLRERGVAAGQVGIEETTDFAFVDGLAQAAPAARLVNGTPVTAGCRMIKDEHELALMRRACAITLAAHRAVFASLREGQTQAEVAALSAEAHRRLGMTGGSLVLFGPDAAFPHGTHEPRPLRAGDVVLIDGGGRLHGYASDLTRTAVFGTPPSDRQRRVWDIVLRAQKTALQAVRPGVPCEAVDAAARRVIEEAGFGPGYRYFTHRVGHGMGMDGHEWTYLVKGNTTPLRPGMCFSDEPGIYIPGELGVRHECDFFVTAEGAELLDRWPHTPEDPCGPA
jgi:Xaa-Pro dipeptidase